MNAAVEKTLLDKIRALTPEQLAEVEAFIEKIAARERRRAAFDKLLAVAPALEKAGVTPPSEEEIVEMVRAVRKEQRQRGADRS